MVDEMKRLDRMLTFLRQRQRLSRRMGLNVATEISALIATFEKVQAAMIVDRNTTGTPQPWTTYYGHFRKVDGGTG